MTTPSVDILETLPGLGILLPLPDRERPLITDDSSYTQIDRIELSFQAPSRGIIGPYLSLNRLASSWTTPSSSVNRYDIISTTKSRGWQPNSQCQFYPVR